MRNKDINRVLNKFIKIEEKHKIFDEKVEGINYWDIVRTFVFFQVVNELGFYEKAAFTKPLDIEGESPVDLPYMSELDSAKSLVVWGNISNRHIISEELFANDTYYLIILKNGKIDEKIYNLNKKMYWWEQGKVDNPIFNNRDELKSRNEIKPLYKIMKDIRKTFKISENVYISTFNRVLTSIYSNINMIYQIKDDLSKIEGLEKIYNILPMYKHFTAAAHLLGLEVIEIQHGIMPSYDVKYTYPKHASLKNTYSPDKIYVNARYWKENAGINYLSEVEVFKSPYEARKTAHINNFSNKNVLFISQWNISEKITKLAIDYAKKNSDKNVIIRLHPVEERTEIETALAQSKLTNISISDARDVYDDLAKSKHVVSAISTTIFQAIENENNVYIYDIFKNKGFKHFYKNNIAKKVTNHRNLSRSINKSWNSDMDQINRLFCEFPENKKL